MIVKLDAVTDDQTWLGWLDRRWQITFTLGLLAIAPLARIVRARTLALREADYVLAARSLGATSRRVIGREVLPNLVPTMLTVAFTGLGILVAAEAALAFLGLSVETPDADVGQADRREPQRHVRRLVGDRLSRALLFLTVLSFNLIGDWLARRRSTSAGRRSDGSGACATARGRRPRHPLPHRPRSGPGRRSACP